MAAVTRGATAPQQDTPHRTNGKRKLGRSALGKVSSLYVPGASECAAIWRFIKKGRSDALSMRAASIELGGAEIASAAYCRPAQQ